MCHKSDFLHAFDLNPIIFIDTPKAALSFLFEDKTHSSFSSTVKDKATSEPIRYNILPLCCCAGL